MTSRTGVPARGPGGCRGRRWRPGRRRGGGRKGAGGPPGPWGRGGLLSPRGPRWRGLLGAWPGAGPRVPLPPLLGGAWGRAAGAGGCRRRPPVFGGTAAPAGEWPPPPGERVRRRFTGPHGQQRPAPQIGVADVERASVAGAHELGEPQVRFASQWQPRRRHPRECAGYRARWHREQVEPGQPGIEDEPVPRHDRNQRGQHGKSQRILAGFRPPSPMAMGAGCPLGGGRGVRGL